MKKPKKQKPKVITPNSLIVDYGLKRVIMPHRVSLMLFYDHELLEIDKWCQKTFATDTWKRSGIFPGYIHFVHAKDATMFTLKWAK